MSDLLAKLLATRPWLLADGATGSNLFAAGLLSGDAPELWNTDHPDRIADLHRRFIEAGADIILTNSFGGNALSPEAAQGRGAGRGVERGRRADRTARGRRERPRRRGRGQHGADRRDPRAARSPQSSTRRARPSPNRRERSPRGGADVLWIETMSSREEAEAAIAGAASTGLPVVCTLSFDTNGRTMMGLAPADLAALHRETSAAPCCLRRQLRRRRVRGRDVHPQSGHGCGTRRRAGRQGQLRHPAIRRRRNPLRRHAGADGRLRAPRARRRRAHHRRLLRHDTRCTCAAMRQALEAHTRGTPPDLATVIAKLGDVSTGARAQWGGDLDRLAGAAPGADTARRRGRRPQTSGTST